MNDKDYSERFNLMAEILGDQKEACQKEEVENVNDKAISRETCFDSMDNEIGKVQ